MPRIRLDSNVSYYLDLARISAAFVVVLHHVFEAPFHEGSWSFPGRPAVMVFFVISGFVIAYSTDGQTDWRRYAVARLARIYSVAVPALVLSALLLLLQDNWPGLPATGVDKPAIRFAVSLLFINQFWNLTVGALTNGPYWSLCYEVWYYVLFGVIVFGRGAGRWIAVVGLLLLVGPRILLLLPIWFLGVATYFMMKRSQPLGPVASRLLFWLCLSLLVWCLWKGSPADALTEHVKQSLTDGYWTLGGWRVFIGGESRFLSDWLLGLLFAGTVLGSRGAGSASAAVSLWRRSVQACSGYTFSLYLFHVPVLIFAHALFAHLLPKPAVPWVMLALIVLAVALLGRVTEHRKEPWTRFFEAVLRRQARSPA